MYVTNLFVKFPGEFTVSVIDSSTNTVIHTIGGIGGFPSGIAFNPANNDMYVTGGTVSVIDSSSNTVVGTIPVGGGAIAFNPANNDMYVTNPNTSTVSVIDSSSNAM
jgi:YVTN family beta-propeller protein